MASPTRTGFYSTADRRSPAYVTGHRAFARAALASSSSIPSGAPPTEAAMAAAAAQVAALRVRAGAAPRRPSPACPGLRHGNLARRADAQPTPTGFTLLELLVVLAIVALLASAAMVGYRQSRIRAAEAAIVSARSTRSTRRNSSTCRAAASSATRRRWSRSARRRRATSTAFVSADLAVSDPLLKSGYVIEHDRHAGDRRGADLHRHPCRSPATG